MSDIENMVDENIPNTESTQSTYIRKGRLREVPTKLRKIGWRNSLFESP